MKGGVLQGYVKFVGGLLWWRWSVFTPLPYYLFIAYMYTHMGVYITRTMCYIMSVARGTEPHGIKAATSPVTGVEACMFGMGYPNVCRHASR